MQGISVFAALVAVAGESVTAIRIPMDNAFTYKRGFRERRLIGSDPYFEFKDWCFTSHLDTLDNGSLVVVP